MPTPPDDTILPENDPDFALARQVGAGQQPENEADRAFLQTLTAFRAAQAMPTPPEVSERLWAAIAPQPPLPRTRRWQTLATHRGFWVAAVVVSLAVGLAWWQLRPTAQPIVVAQSQSQQVRYTAPDGSVVTLRPYSRLTALQQDETVLRYQLTGEGYFEVVPNPARTFTVETDAARVSVLGTRFNVSTWGEQTTVYLDEGRVQLEHRALRQTVVLAPGQRSSTDPAGLMPVTEDRSEYVDWLRNELVFTRRPASQVVAELQQQFDVRLELPDALLSETLSGRILLQDPAASLHDLATVLGGRFVSVGTKRYRWQPNNGNA